jgi:hypothetical protein
MHKKLAESGLDPQDAARLGFVPHAAPPSGISFRDAPGFTIPYLTNNGFFRYRYLVPVYADKKQVKYSQPANSGNHVYVPQNFDWGEWRKRPEGKRIILTEGELKAACAAKHGLPCLGLGGVWNFKDKHSCLLPELRDYCDWGEMHAYITFDSDAVTNPHVMQAENQLARELLGLGTVVYIVRLPSLFEGAKTGLDDYLENEKEGGVDRFLDLALRSQPWELSRVLHEMNERFIFVKNPGMVMDTSDWHLMTPEKMKEGIFANLYYETQVKKGSSLTTVKKKAAPAWIGWEQRMQVQRLTYAPGIELVTPSHYLNTWRGWGVSESEVKKGDVSPWAELLDFLFKDAPKERRWFEQWVAYHVQHPNVKMLTAVILWGHHKGTGKTLVGYTMKHIYGDNYKEIEEGDLLGVFNSWAANKQFVQGDEITGSFDKRGSANRIKTCITRLTVTINEKFLPAYELEDCISYFFTSNHPNSFFIEDEERRYFVHEVKGAPLPREFYAKYDAWYHQQNPDGAYIPGPGIGPLMWHLCRLDLSGFDPRAAAPETEAMRNMVSMGRFPVEDWARAVAADPDCVKGFPPRVSLLTPQQCYLAWVNYNGGPDKTIPQHVGAALSAAGLRRTNHGQQVRCAEGMVYLWGVRDRERVEKMKYCELAELRDAEVARETINLTPKEKF